MFCISFGQFQGPPLWDTHLLWLAGICIPAIPITMLGCEDRLKTVSPMIWSAFHDKLKFAIEKLRVVQLCRCLRSLAVCSQLLAYIAYAIRLHIYTYICIYQLLVLFVFLHRYLDALVSHIHQYSAFLGPLPIKVFNFIGSIVAGRQWGVDIVGQKSGGITDRMETPHT